MEPCEISFEAYQLLPYDLQEEIDKYTLALEAHASTEGQAAPAADTIVENIVKFHGGAFVIVAPPPKAELRPLPADPKYYKSKEDAAKIAVAAKKQAGGKENDVPK